MGIPYSKQINAAFDQVTPLVAEGFEVLQTTKNISILLAIIQVVTVILQLFSLIVLLAILLSVNPDTISERQAIVTPIMQSMAAWIMPGSEGRWVLKVVGWCFLGVWLCACAGAAYYFSFCKEGSVLMSREETPMEDKVERQDVDAVKDGSAAS